MEEMGIKVTNSMVDHEIKSEDDDNDDHDEVDDNKNDDDNDHYLRRLFTFPYVENTRV